MHELDWHKLPPDLQYKFMAEAMKESEKVKGVISSLTAQLKSVMSEAGPYFRRIPESDEVPTVGAVDGSRSVAPSLRLGSVYSVAASYFIAIRGRERAAEDGETLSISWAEPEERRKRLVKLEMLMTKAERELAVRNLGSVDYMLIDGTFFGFLRTAVRAKSEGLMDDDLRRTVEETVELTERLVESGKAFAVIKRSRTRALVGHLYLRRGHGRLDFAGSIDKLLLTLAMPGGTYLRYEELDELHPVLLTSYANYYEAGRADEAKIRENAERPYREFSVPLQNLYGLKRVQVKAYERSPACEFEYRDGTWERLERLIGVKGLFNEATGLPLVSDMVDSLVTIPQGFIDEYVEEVMARALEGLGEDALELLRAFFFSMNPQKPY